MKYLAVLFAIIIVILLFYIIAVKAQLRSVIRQLKERRGDKARHPISIEMLDRDMIEMTKTLNICFKEEEQLLLKSVREENDFKELIANISHDLRTPLTAIKGYLQLLDTKELNEEQRRKLLIAQKHSKELGALVEHFFEYAYLVNHTPEIRMEKINFNNLVTDTMSALVTMFEERGLEIIYEEGSAVYVSSDRELLTRIVQNLFKNCAQHAAGSIMVSIGTKEAENKAYLKISNPVEEAQNIDAKRLFERFYTGDRARRSGTGLGLSIVKLLTEQLNETVEAAIDGSELSIMLTLKKALD